MIVTIIRTFTIVTIVTMVTILTLVTIVDRHNREKRDNRHHRHNRYNAAHCGASVLQPLLLFGGWTRDRHNCHNRPDRHNCHNRACALVRVRTLLGSRRVLLCSRRAILGSLEFSWVKTRHPSLETSWVLLGYFGFSWVLLGSLGISWVLLRSERQNPNPTPVV